MRPPAGGSRSGQREALDKVPPFLLKLWEIIENNSVPADGSSPCVSWGAEGKSFVIHETETFARNILPLYFKHDNIRSFMRQLNIYSFTRCPKKANSTGNRNAVEFSHPNFIRGCIYLLTEFKRGTVKLGGPPGQPGLPAQVLPQDQQLQMLEQQHHVAQAHAHAQAQAHAHAQAQAHAHAQAIAQAQVQQRMHLLGPQLLAEQGGGSGVGGGGSSSVGPDHCTPPASTAGAGAASKAAPGPTISALREEVMTLKDSIAHLEQEMLHHTSVTHDHMKKLAALIVSFQDAPIGPAAPGPGLCGGQVPGAGAPVVSSQFANLPPPAPTMPDSIPGFPHVTVPQLAFGAQQSMQQAMQQQCRAAGAPSASGSREFSNGNGNGGAAREGLRPGGNGSGGTCTNAVDGFFVQ